MQIFIYYKAVADFYKKMGYSFKTNTPYIIQQSAVLFFFFIMDRRINTAIPTPSSKPSPAPIARELAEKNEPVVFYPAL